MSAVTPGRKLRALRLRMGISLADLARRMDMTPSEISRRELGFDVAEDLWFTAAARACGADEPTPTGDTLMSTMTPERASALIERSKNDRDLIVGSEVREVCRAYLDALSEIDRLREAAAASTGAGLEAELAAALAREPLPVDSAEDRVNRVEAKVEQLQAEVSALTARLVSADASSLLDMRLAPRLPGALDRLRRVCPGDLIYGREQDDLGFAVDLALDHRTHHTTAFALAKTFQVATGAGTGEGPVRPVEWWDAEGWDVIPLQLRQAQAKDDGKDRGAG